MVKGVFVEEKSFINLYQEGDIVTLMEPEIFEQLEVLKELFGKVAAYLKASHMTLQCFDDWSMTGTVPQRVTCIVVEAQPNTKGLDAQPQMIWKQWWQHRLKMDNLQSRLHKLFPTSCRA